ncbi:MAG: winged helix-turn-helix domain-containing protein [Oscillospiraceae bacterium]|nr:winged helix-turn-helix domain-containing protein [Oscillospiraceae bacterium]
MERSWEIERLKAEFRDCQKLLQALGDETRQYLILQMLQPSSCHGLRVGAIMERTNLSRPAVSRHLKILREAGVIKIRREGTKNYYYFAVDEPAIDQVILLLQHVKQITASLPQQAEEA